MKKNKILFAILAFLLLSSGSMTSSPATAWAAASSCVECHTNEQALKTLHKPAPVVASEEGEG